MNTDCTLDALLDATRVTSLLAYIAQNVHYIQVKHKELPHAVEFERRACQLSNEIADLVLQLEQLNGDIMRDVL